MQRTNGGGDVADEINSFLAMAAAAIERWAARPTRALGLRPEFPFARLLAWAKAHGGVELIERRRLKPLGAYTLVRFRRVAAQAQAA